METLQAFFGVSLGFWFYQLFSSPSHKFYLDKIHPNMAKRLRKLKYKIYWKAVPSLKTKRIQLLPAVRIRIHGHSIWIHHWITLTVVLGVLIHETNSFSQLIWLKGFCFGGAVQGFLYKDRFKVINKLTSQDQSRQQQANGLKR